MALNFHIASKLWGMKLQQTGVCTGVIIFLVQVPSPPEWAHGCLEDLKVFLQERIAEGSYKPMFHEGLT